MARPGFDHGEMETSKRSRGVEHAVARAAILLVGILTLLMVVPTIAVPWLQIGATGIGTKYLPHPLLHPVQGLPAARAGIQNGDLLISIEPDHLFFHPGTELRVTVERDGRLHAYRLRVGQAIPYSVANTVVHVVTVALSAAAICASFVLALRRSTWATTLLALSSMTFGSFRDTAAVWGLVLSNAQSDALYWALVLAFDTLPAWTFVLFALAFPRSLWSRGRAVLAIGVFFIAIAQATISQTTKGYLSGTIPLVAALAAFAFSYTRAETSDRPRLTWLMAAVATFLGVQVAGIVAGIVFQTALMGYSLDLVYRIYDISDIFIALMWFTIVYAVWQRHVVGIAFAVNRGLVAAFITAMVLGVVSLARWYGEHTLARSGSAGLLGAGLTVLVGYGLNRIVAPTQSIIEQFVFRRRYAAERRVLQSIASLPYAKSRATVARVVVDEVCEELRIASAALFLENGNQYERVRALEWPDDAALTIDADDRLPRVLFAEGCMQKLRDLRWRLRDAPTGEAEPITVYPLGWHGALTGFVLYGRHNDGSDIDPQERSLLKQLADTAAMSYETAGVAEMRRRISFLEKDRLAIPIAGGNDST